MARKDKKEEENSKTHKNNEENENELKYFYSLKCSKKMLKSVQDLNQP